MCRKWSFADVAGARKRNVWNMEYALGLHCGFGLPFCSGRACFSGNMHDAVSDGGGRP
jgi:hypothetical protein